MNRRGFLRAIGACASALAVGAWPRPSRARGAPVPVDPAALAARIRERFAYLKLDDAVVAAYVRDFGASRHREAVRADGELPDATYHRFLLSTDFFQHGADETRRLRYVALYEPYETPCYNPLARPGGTDARGGGSGKP